MTVRLHLLRHAKSSWADDSIADHERPLAPRGVRAAAQLRRHLATQRVRPSLVVCSSATRARRTLELVLPALAAPRVLVEDGVYLATADELVQRLRRLPDDAHEVMIVGHHPGLHDLATVLVERAWLPELAQSLPTGGLLTLDLPAASWQEVAAGTATLVSFVKPRELPA